MVEWKFHFEMFTISFDKKQTNQMASNRRLVFNCSLNIARVWRKFRRNRSKQETLDTKLVANEWTKKITKLSTQINRWQQQSIYIKIHWKFVRKKAIKIPHTRTHVIQFNAQSFQFLCDMLISPYWLNCVEDWDFLLMLPLLSFHAVIVTFHRKIENWKSKNHRNALNDEMNCLTFKLWLTLSHTSSWNYIKQKSLLA